MGSRVSAVAGAVARISAAHITDNLLCSAGSIRNKVLLCRFSGDIHRSSFHLLTGFQGISCVPSHWSSHVSLRSWDGLCEELPTNSILRAGKKALQNTAP